MSAATSPGTALHLALRPAAGLRRLVSHGPLASFYAMTSGQHAEQPPAKRRGPKPAISRPGAMLVAIDPCLTWRHQPWEGEGYRKRLGSASGLSRHPGCPQAGAPPDARDGQSALAPSLPPPLRQSPCDGEINTHAPNHMSGSAPMAFGCSRWTTAGAGSRGFTAVEHWNAECVGWHVCKFAATASPPCSGSPWGAGLVSEVRLTPTAADGRGDRGLALQWPGSRLPVSVGPLHQPDQVLGRSSRPGLRRRAPDQRRSPSASIAR